MEGEEGERLNTPSRPHFVLVHGLCGGAWSWFKIKCLLEHCSGYKATCLNLRGCGTEPTDGSTIQSFDDYNQPLEDFLATLPETEKVILVGYSAGGLSVTQVLHKFANKIQLVVYVAATMLRFGFQTPDDLRIGIPDNHSGMAHWKGLVDNSHRSPVRTPEWPLFSLYLPIQGIPDFSEHGFTPENPTKGPEQPTMTCSLEEMTLAEMLVRPGPPIGALQTATWPATEAAEKIPRVYIKTERDRVLKPEQQEEMIRRWPPATVYEIDSDHNPLFAAPLLLTGFLLKAVTSFT